MLVMIGYIFMFRMVKKMQTPGLEIVAGLTLPVSKELNPLQDFYKCVVNMCNNTYNN